MAFSLAAPSVLPHAPLHLRDQPPSHFLYETHRRRWACHTWNVFATYAAPSSEPAKPSPTPKKPALTMKKGEIVRVDRDKYLSSVEYLAVGHPLNYKGLDYIYEDRGEILDVRIFDTGEYALVGWAGIPTSPAWLPTTMLIKSEKLSYRRT